MKTVFSNSDLVHTFAQQTQNYGKSGTMFFRDKNIYSYGYHYLLGEFINSSTIIINDIGYSNSTSKHISLLRQATRQYKQYFTTDIDLKFVYNKIINLNERLPRAIKKELICSDILSSFENLQKYLIEFEHVNLLQDKMFIEINEI